MGVLKVGASEWVSLTRQELGEMDMSSECFVWEWKFLLHSTYICFSRKG